MKKGSTEMVFILDRSGSMSGMEEDTIGGFNSMLTKQKKEDGEATVTTILFDTNVEIIHDRFDLATIGKMTDEEYYVRGCTALLDAVGIGIKKEIAVQKHLSEDQRAEKVIFVIITDGLENASRNFSYDEIKGMIKKQQEKYGWEFMFLGANIDAVSEGGRLGIRPDRAVRYCHDREGTALNYGAVGSALSKLRSLEDMSQMTGEWCAEIMEDYRARGKKAENEARDGIR